MKRKYNKVAVLKGGISSEREISLRSGAAIAQGLREGGYEVVEVDITSRTITLPAGVEAAFIALHGTFGEDGEIQQMLADEGLPFTGSGAESSRISFDKILTRERLAADGVPIPAGEVLKNDDERAIATPLVVKPPCEGSSVGCHIVTSESDWEASFSDALRFSDKVLVEEYIPGRELTVGIVGMSDVEYQTGNPDAGEGLQVLPVVEIRTATAWYDYAAKYVTGETKYTVPAELDDETAAELKSIALKAFKCLGAGGFGRIDFRLSPEGRPYVLELNTIPGFTATSLLPKAAQAAGIGFSELCCRIMELAKKR